MDKRVGKLMGMRMLVVFVLLGGAAWAKADDATENESASEKNAFWFIATTNYHNRLEPSEAMVNNLLNTPMSLVFPRWEDPKTFKDWEDDFIVWDLTLGYGQDINDKWSWSVYCGGGYGKISNSKRYFPLGVPLKINADFARRSYTAGTSIVWHPLGRPEKTRRGLIAALRETKPQMEMNIGYTHQTSIANVTFKLPGITDLFHIEVKDKYNLFWTSPRAGVEIPITEVDSLNILGGYLFFHDMEEEYNGWMLEFYWRHRF